MTSVHRSIAGHRSTGWACRLLACDQTTPPLACVLLLVSVVMMTVAAVVFVLGVG